MKLRKNQMISPKKFLFPTEEIKNSHVGIIQFSRGYCFLQRVCALAASVLCRAGYQCVRCRAVPWRV